MLAIIRASFVLVSFVFRMGFGLLYGYILVLGATTFWKIHGEAISSFWDDVMMKSFSHDRSPPAEDSWPEEDSRFE